MDYLLIILVLCPFLMAPVAYAAGRKSSAARSIISGAVIASVLIISAYLLFDVIQGKTPALSIEGFCGMGLTLKLDGFRAIHAVLASFLWLCTAMFNREYSVKVGDKKQSRYTLFNLLTLGATLGVFLSADLFSIFIFFEIMSFTSYMWVLHDGTEKSAKAAETYLGVSVICGMIMLMGLFLLYNSVGTLDISELYSACAAVLDRGSIYLAGALILVGFGAKAGMYPLHIWMPKSYPAAPAPASALLSGILSKAGVYGIIVISSSIFLHDPKWGMAVLILGTVTMFWGGIIGIFSVDIKKIISCSSMSQIGFILVGIGMQGLLGEENAFAVRGTLLHMINHSLIKLVLFTVVGVIFMNIKKYSLNDVRGYGRGKPVMAFCFTVASLGIGGIPFFNGYVSKTLLHESIVEYSGVLASQGLSTGFFTLIEWIFLVSGGLTLAYMLKVFVALFVEKGKFNKTSKYMSKLTGISMVIPTMLMLLIGALPNITADSIANLGQGIMGGVSPKNPVNYFSFMNIKGALISITLGILFYLIIVRKLMMNKNQNGHKVYIDRWPENFDLETMVYRPLVQVIFPGIIGAISTVMDRWILKFFYKISMYVLNAYAVVTSSVTDKIIYGLKDTVFSTLKEKKQRKLKSPVAYRLGALIDKLKKTADSPSSYAETMQNYEEESAMRRKMISASLSYGLMFCGLGLVIVLLYLLLM